MPNVCKQKRITKLCATQRNSHLQQYMELLRLWNYELRVYSWFVTFQMEEPQISGKKFSLNLVGSCSVNWKTFILESLMCGLSWLSEWQKRQSFEVLFTGSLKVLISDKRPEDLNIQIYLQFQARNDRISNILIYKGRLASICSFFLISYKPD